MVRSSMETVPDTVDVSVVLDRLNDTLPVSIGEENDRHAFAETQFVVKCR